MQAHLFRFRGELAADGESRHSRRAPGPVASVAAAVSGLRKRPNTASTAVVVLDKAVKGITPARLPQAGSASRHFP
jgi:hypothetical protein